MSEEICTPEAGKSPGQYRRWDLAIMCGGPAGRPVVRVVLGTNHEGTTLRVSDLRRHLWLAWLLWPWRRVSRGWRGPRRERYEDENSVDRRKLESGDRLYAGLRGL